MQTKLRIVRFLIENQNKTWSIRSIAKALNINYKIVYEQVTYLEKSGAINILRFGNSSQCKYNYRFNDYAINAELERTKKLLKNKNINVILTRLSEIKSPFYVCLIFGSSAKGKETKVSDVDICVISDSDEIITNIARILRTVSVRTHYLSFSAKEFISMLKTTEQNVGKEILANYVILKGAEQFYGLINNAR